MHDREAAIEKVLEGLRKGMPEYAAAEQAGTSFPTWFRWKEDTAGLRERVAEAKRGRVVLYEDALHRVALKGSVTALLTLLRKESKEWRELLDGTFAPTGTSVAVAMGAAAGAATVLSMLSPEKRERLRLAMRREGLIVLPPPSTNGNGAHSNGNGAGH